MITGGKGMESRNRTQAGRTGAVAAVKRAPAFALVFLLALSPRPAQAQESDGAEPVAPAVPATATAPTSKDKGNKHTKIDFEDQLVEGQAQKPELFYLLQQRNANFKRLIRLREDFLPEMRKTANEVQRKGSPR